MLKRGITYVHEHTFIDLSHLKNLDDCKFDNYDQVVVEFKKLYDLGVRNIIDVTNEGMKRRVDYVNKVAKETNINIIQATGYYQEIFITDIVKNMTVDELAQKMIDDIEIGIDGTSTKAQVIGEIATSKNEMTDNEKKVFDAAVIAHKRTNKVISTHTTLGTYGIEQVDYFIKNDVDLDKVIIGHVDLTGDYLYIKSMLEKGVNVEFDTVGKNNYQPDELRVDILKRLINDGFLNKIMLSMDITRKSNLEDQGGIGYCYMLTTFKDMMLEKGISEVEINQMLIENPLRVYGEEKDE